MMDEGVSLATKAAAGIGAATAGGTAVVDVVTQNKVVILGVEQPVLMAAIVGALIGVMLLREHEAAQVSAPTAGAPWRRALTLVVRAGSLGAFVLAYALLAAWIVTALAIWFPAFLGPAQMSLAGISGVLAKRMLPRYLEIVDNATGFIAGKAGGK